MALARAATPTGLHSLQKISWARRSFLLAAPLLVLFASCAGRLANADVTLTTQFFNGSNGAGPTSLTIDPTGIIYGATQSGGLGDSGTIFKVLPNGTPSTIVNFNINNSVGVSPTNLVTDSFGNLYGTTTTGVLSGEDFNETGFNVIEIAAGSSAVKTLASFNINSGNMGNLVSDRLGNVYGTTFNGGAVGAGAIFKIPADTTGANILASFAPPSNGSGPTGLAIDPNGNLYGMTITGLAFSNVDGTVFSLAPGSHTIHTIAAFNGTNGMGPQGGFVIDGSGNLYGTTNGDISNSGSIFKIATGTSTISTVATFNDNNGTSPQSLIVDAAGNLYGTTSGSGPAFPGPDTYGSVFKVAAGSHTVTTLVSFNGSNGHFPTSLSADSSGNLFGVATYGGPGYDSEPYGEGTVFKVTGSGFILSALKPNIISFYDIYPASVLATGHAFLEMVPSNAASVGTFFCGFNPVFTSPIAGGVIKDERNTAWNYRISYQVSDQAYNAAAGTINRDIANPPFYNVLSFNCVDWAKKIASAAGITLPAATDAAGVSDPLTFGQFLQSIGNGGTINGGVVQGNPAITSSTTQAAATVGGTIDFSYAGLELAGHANATTLATGLGIPLDLIDIGPVNANFLTGITIDLANTDPSNALISINWGDGSPFEEQTLQFGHVYGSGKFMADVLVIDDGAIHDYQLEIGVSSSPGATVTVNPTAFLPIQTPNPGLISASLIPMVPEPALGIGSAVVTVIALCARRPKVRRRANMLESSGERI